MGYFSEAALANDCEAVDFFQGYLLFCVKGDVREGLNLTSGCPLPIVQVIYNNHQILSLNDCL